MSRVRRTIVLLLVPSALFSQTLTRPEADAFARALLWNNDSINAWFDASSLTTSHRLGIEYEGVGHKNLISCDVDDSLKQMVRDRRLGYSVALDTLDSTHVRLTLSIDKTEGTREYYFSRNRCISPLDYFARKWPVHESDHFRFYLSDSTLFNAYCIGQLESFLARMGALLGLADSDMQTLRKEKILYYLCRDEDEIEHLTGFRARGIYNLAYDAVITTYNAHFHELTHLLVNYKLRRLPLYTHPFLQEGFAVAYGGRGGMESGVLLPTGNFLYRSGLVELSSLLDRDSFDQVDASVSYPASGLYNKFLVENVGIEHYLKLYRAHSGSPRSPGTLRMASDELPSDTKWKSYLEESARFHTITFDTASANARTIFRDSTGTISGDDVGYNFDVADVLIIPGPEVFPHYTSKLFRELFPDSAYKGDEFLIRANSAEISVYNLFTNNLIANYVASFSLPPVEVPVRGGRYFFKVRGNVFDMPLSVLFEQSKPEHKR